MEQDREVRDLEQVEAWVEAAAARVKVAAVRAVAVVLPQDLVVTAFAPTVVKERPINWEFPVMTRNARNVVPP